MRSLRALSALVAALLATMPIARLRAQAEVPAGAPDAEPPSTGAPGGGEEAAEPTEGEPTGEETPEEPAPEEAPTDREAAPPAPAGPLVPPGGVPDVGGPVPGQRDRPEPEPEPPPPPIPPPIYSVELQIRASFPPGSSFDAALVSLRYRSVRIVPTGYVGAQVPIVEWLWVGGRLGIRGMSWRHLERDDATVVAGDLLATAQVRFAVGRILELGVLFGGGVGWMNVQLNGANSDSAVGRFLAEGVVAFRPDRHIAIGPRFGWEYFQWEGMNEYDHGLDIGGPFFGLSLEGRE